MFVFCEYQLSNQVVTGIKMAVDFRVLQIMFGHHKFDL